MEETNERLILDMIMRAPNVEKLIIHSNKLFYLHIVTILKIFKNLIRPHKSRQYFKTSLDS